MNFQAKILQCSKDCGCGSPSSSLSPGAGGGARELLSEANSCPRLILVANIAPAEQKFSTAFPSGLLSWAPLSLMKRHHWASLSLISTCGGGGGPRDSVRNYRLHIPISCLPFSSLSPTLKKKKNWPLWPLTTNMNLSFFRIFIYLFIFDPAGSLLLCGVFSSSGEWGLLSTGVGFSCC